MSFKPGDRVVVKNGGKFRPGTIVHELEVKNIYKVEFASKHWGYFGIRNIILEEVYFSPLFEAMKEDE